MKKGDIEAVERFGEKSAENILEKAVDNYKLSLRAVHKILKVGRTIADMENEKIINSKHIGEAIQYRFMQND